MTAGRAAVVATWAATLAGVVAVLLVVRGPEVPVWLALALVLSVVVALVGQLAVGEQQGFVGRTAAATSGSLLVVLVAAGTALAVG